MHVNLTPFLEKDTGVFMKELWALLLDGQSNVEGIPTALLAQKRAQIAQRKVRGRTLWFPCLSLLCHWPNAPPIVVA